MPNNEATGRIRIIKTPAGDAPFEIRDGWVMRAALPCYPYVGYPSGVVKDVLSGREVKIEKIGVVVPQDKALEILGRHNPMVAKWWTDRGYPKPGKAFFFTEDEFTIISGVAVLPVRVFENMETGRWRQMLP
ncbi:MAG: hypothetical protein PHD04_03110 [Candidatus Pacebacteria bacterium]|nr:hypothetical protein [Candidatus Paceibacterota bacterium]